MIDIESLEMEGVQDLVTVILVCVGTLLGGKAASHATPSTPPAASVQVPCADPEHVELRTTDTLSGPMPGSALIVAPAASLALPALASVRLSYPVPALSAQYNRPLSRPVVGAGKDGGL